MGRPRISVIVVCFAAMLGGIGPDAGAAGTATLWVDGAHAACSGAFSREEASAESTPWCSVTPAAAAAGAGTPSDPSGHLHRLGPAGGVGVADGSIRYVAPDGGVTIDAGGAGAAMKVVSVSDVSFEGIAITGATTQGVGVRCAACRPRPPLGAGQRRAGDPDPDSAAVTVSRSAIAGNGGAGILETIGCSDGRSLQRDHRQRHQRRPLQRRRDPARRGEGQSPGTPSPAMATRDRTSTGSTQRRVPATT